MILSFGAGAIAGGSAQFLLMGGEARSVTGWFVPKAIAMCGGASVGLNVGASVSLQGGYMSDIPFFDVSAAHATAPPQHL